MAPLLRLAGVLAYFWMAHRAVALERPRDAGIALGLLVFIVFIGGLLRLNPRACLWSAALVLAIFGVVYADLAMTVLLFMPTVFLTMAASVFARTLVKGRTPFLVTAASLVEGSTPETMPADVRTYVTRQTWAWALLLGGIAVLNFVLALIAVPDGALARAGLAVPDWVSSEAATRYVPKIIYVSVTGFLVGEFIYRQRRFPGRYKNVFDYIRKASRVPPSAWREAFAKS